MARTTGGRCRAGGLVVGRVLDRPALRLLRRELRRAEALTVAGRALRSRDLSRKALAQRLERSAVAPVAAAESLETLARAGFVDDGRVAHSRARALAERGYGDEAIRHRLAAEGVAEHTEAALADLTSETDRAAAIVARRGSGTKTARYLAGRGFGQDAVESALGAVLDRTTEQR